MNGISRREALAAMGAALAPRLRAARPAGYLSPPPAISKAHAFSIRSIPRRRRAFRNWWTGTPTAL